MGGENFETQDIIEDESDKEIDSGRLLRDIGTSCVQKPTKRTDRSFLNLFRAATG